MAENIQTAIPEFIENANILDVMINGGINEIPRAGLKTLTYYNTLFRGGISHYVAGIAYTAGQFAFTLEAGEIKFWQARLNIAMSPADLNTAHWTARAVFGAGGGDGLAGAITLYAAGSNYVVGDIVIRIVNGSVRTYQAVGRIMSAPARFRPQDWNDITQESTNSVTLKAYATSLAGAGIRVGSVSSGTYTNPPNIGKQFEGIATVSQGEPVPTAASAYTWAEIPGRIRIILADYGSRGTSVSGTKNLRQNLTDFTHLEVLWSSSASSRQNERIETIPISLFTQGREWNMNQKSDDDSNNTYFELQYISARQVRTFRISGGTLISLTGIR